MKNQNNQAKINKCKFYLKQKLKQEKTREVKGVSVTLPQYNLENPMKNSYDYQINKEQILEMMSEDERNNNDIDLIIKVADYILKQGTSAMMEIENEVVQDIQEAHKKFGLAS